MVKKVIDGIRTGIIIFLIILLVVIFKVGQKIYRFKKNGLLKSIKNFFGYNKITDGL